jgi:hypothetical protein
MTTTPEASVGAKTPWHLWAVGAFGLLWNAYGAYDYAMSKLQGAPYYQSVGMTPAQIAQMDAMPTWMTSVWAVGVWGAVMGSVLLLLRSRLAVPVFAASLAGFVMSLVYAYVLAPNPEAATQGIMMIQGVILAGCLFFLWYAHVQSKAGRLR